MFASEFEKTATVVQKIKAPFKLAKNIGKNVYDWTATPLGAAFVGADAMSETKHIKQQAQRPFGSKIGPKQWSDMHDKGA